MDSIKRYQAFVLLAASLLVTYAVIVITPYVFTDDYPTYVEKLNGTLWESMKHGIISVGRPIYALALYAGFSMVDNISDLRLLRLFGVLGVAMTSWFVYALLRKQNWSTPSSLAVAFIIGTLPAFQVYASWSITFIFPWACALAGLSVYVLGTSINKYVKVILSLILLTISFNTYQPAATIFWLFAAIQLFGSENIIGKVRAFALRFGIYFVAAAASLVVQKVMVAILGEKYASARTGIATDIIEKVKWFFKKPLVDSANLHNIQPSIPLAIIVLILIAVGLWFYFHGTSKDRLILLMMSFSLLPLSYIPNLVATESWSGYRTQVGLESLIVIYLFFAIWGIIQNFSSRHSIAKVLVFTGVTVAGLWSAYNVTLGFVIPQYVELTSIRQQVDDERLPQTKKIYVIQNQWNQSAAPFVAYDEFGFPSSAAAWVPKNSMYIVLGKIDPQYQQIPVEVVDDPNKAVWSDETMVIDMRKTEDVRKLYFE